MFVLFAVLGMIASPVRAAASLELYGTFEAMGVIVNLDGGDDPDGDAVAQVEYRLSGNGSYQQGFPLARVDLTRFVGSLFWLEPGKSYDVRVTFSDPDGHPIGGTVLESSWATRAEISIPTPTHSYYVSPLGSGSTCNATSPCSLAEGLSQVQPGEAVVLRGGTYYEGEFDFPRSGTAGAPIMVQSYSGESAILDGADPAAFTWTAQGGGVYHTTVNAPDPHMVLADGQRLFPYENLTNLQNLSRDNTPGFLADGTSIYVHLAGGADPNAATMEVARYNYAFYVEQDYVYFQDLTFRNYGQDDYAKAIYLNNANDNLVHKCTFASNDLGVGLKRESHRNVIQDSEFYDTIFNWPWDSIKELGGLEDGGISFYDPVDGRGNIIRRNTFHDDFDGFGVCPNNTDRVTNETDVYDNLVYNMGDDGVETDGLCSNVRFWGNTFHDVLMGISLAPVYVGPVYAIRNLIYRTGVGNNDYSGSPFKFNSGYDQSGPMYLFHNTSDAALPGNNGIYIKAPGTWEMIYARNNIWSGTDYALNNYNEDQPIDFDYDDLYTTNPDEFVYWGDGSDRHMRDLPTFQALTGQELNGFNLEPGFADPVGADYTLDAASDLIDVGLLIPGINHDFVGTAPDIGAFEYEGHGFTMDASPQIQAIEPGGTAIYVLDLQPVGGFSGTVILSASPPSPSQTLTLDPENVELPGQATLTITDQHTSVENGLWYNIPISGEAGEVLQQISLELLVGGTRVYLPLVFR
jgi:hypothetical protein